MVEFGTSRAGAHPFMAPAIFDGRDGALAAIEARFVQEVNS
jgi:hypothetical protein